MTEQTFNEEDLEKLFYETIKQRFGSQVSLKQFLKWCWEWVNACNTIKRIAEQNAQEGKQ